MAKATSTRARYHEARVFFASDDDWAVLARSLSLVPYRPSAGYGHRASFRQLKRALGAPAASPPSVEHWLYGHRGGSEVLVVVYSTGSGKNRTTWTACVTRIDPPLLLGVDVSSQSALFGLFGGSDIQLGLPNVDGALELHAADPQRLRQLLWPTDATGQHLLATLMSGGNVRVTDSAVRFTLRGIEAAPHVIARQLEAGAWIGKTLAARRHELGPTQAELAQQVVWRAAADGLHLRFDAARMRLEGELAGAGVEIALETDGGAFTAVTCRFPRSIGVNVRLRRAGALHFLDGLLDQDIRVGDPAFDGLYVVQGYPEPAVRQVLSNGPLRFALSNLAARADEVTMNDMGLFFRMRGVHGTEPELSGLLSFVRHVVGTIFGEVQSLGPYR
jgi:hypothetical protein